MNLWMTAASLWIKAFEQAAADTILTEEGDRFLTEDLYHILME